MSTKMLMLTVMLFLSAVIILPAFSQEAAPAVEVAPAADAVIADTMGAIDEEAALDDEELPYYSYGTVVSATADMVTVKEVIYEEEAEKEVNVDYKLNTQTEMEGYTAVGDIKANDEIEIYYLEADNVKTASLLIKNDYTEEDFQDYGDENFDEAAPVENMMEAEPVVETQTNTVQ